MLRACPALAFLRSAPLMGYGGNVAAASLCVKVSWDVEGLASQPAVYAASAAAFGCWALLNSRHDLTSRHCTCIITVMFAHANWLGAVHMPVCMQHTMFSKIYVVWPALPGRHA